jgi:beta-glucanase (GH16 family)
MTFNPNNPTASGLVLTFDDVFDGVSWSSNGPADGTLWTDQGINPGPPNGIAAISPNNLSVSNGVLDITASEGANGTWTSGMLTTVNSALQGFTQKFGYFEADIQIPKGDGAWPAWWLYSANHFINGAPPSEIDIMENAGSNTTNFGTTIHDGLGNQNPNVVQNAGVDLSAGFHRYGMLWDPNSSSVTWYLDGNAVATSAKFSDTDMQKMLMTLDLEVGNFGGGGPDASTPSTMNMLVDYVRVYQFASQNPVAVQPEAVSTAAGNTDPTALVNALGVAPSGSTSQPASVSADGTALHAGAGGNLTTSAGTWTLSANTAPGGDVVLLNGQQATDGAATELIVENNGHMFADNAQGNWYEWVNGNWSQTTDPVPVAASGSTSALTSPSAPTAVSADGTALHAGAGGSLVTSDGTWTLSANTAPGGDVVLLNGQQATDGAATELIVENNGHMFAENTQGNWYEWANGNWSQTTNPTADSSILTAGSGGNLTTSSGTWTLGAHTAPGGDVILLNGQQAGNGAATRLVVDNHGDLLADNSGGNWYEWAGGHWSQVHPTAAQGGSGTTAPPTLTPSFIDAANHDIFVFNSMTSASQIANFNGSEDVLDVTSLLKSVGYTGTDPIADHVLNLVQSGTDSTAVMVDPTGHNPSHGTTLVTLDHVLPQNVATANIWH